MIFDVTGTNIRSGWDRSGSKRMPLELQLAPVSTFPLVQTFNLYWRARIGYKMGEPLIISGSS